MDDNTKDTVQEPVEEIKETVEEVKEAVEEVKETVAEIKEKVKETPKVSKTVSANLEKIIESIEKLSVLELADLVKALEEKFGVSAAPMAMAGPASPTIAGAEAVSEQTSFNVILTSGGANKIAAIKAVREIVPTLGLKEAKDLVEAAPKPVLEGVNKATAEEAKAKLTAAGGTVELQ